MDTMKSCTEVLIPCSFSVGFAHQSDAIVMGLVRLSQPAHGRHGTPARSGMSIKAGAECR